MNAAIAACASDTYFDLDDYETQQALALGLFDCFSVADATDAPAQGGAQ